MIDGKKLKYVIENIVSEDFNYPLACQILDFFEKHAKTLDDYDTLGEISMIAKHDSLTEKCAHYTYSQSKTREQLYLSRENLIAFYIKRNQPETALFYVEINLKINPNDIKMLMHKASCLSLLGYKDQGDAILEQIKTDDPSLKKEIKSALSGKQFRMGNTAQGIKDFILALKGRNTLFEDKLKLTLWEGGAEPGKTIVINGEGGAGDEIINIRFLDRFKEMGMKPILYSSWHMYRPDLVKLFRRHGYEVTTNHLFFKKGYLWTHMMALPGYMNLEEKDLWSGPYLQPLRQEKNQLNDKNFKIGIKCNGNPYYDQDIYRCIPIDEMVKALPKSASIYYFDKEKTHPDCVNLKDCLETWEDTLDYIDQMDVIVSSCTSLVHAAGAMGKRTIVLASIAEYYVWTSTRTNETTPWYGDHLKVIKQTKIRDWSQPLHRARALVDEYMLESSRHV